MLELFGKEVSICLYEGKLSVCKRYVNLFVKEPNRKQTLLPPPAEVESANQISGTSHIANISSIFSKMVFTRCTMPGLNKNAVQTSCHKLGVH